MNDQPENLRVRIRDIAAAVGVSEATVSYALNGSGRVGAATAARIRDTAKTMGYLPNPLLREVMVTMRRSGNPCLRGTFGFLHYEPSDQAIARAPTFLGRVYRGAKAQAKKLGFAMDPISMQPYLGEDRRLSEVLWARGIRGVFMGSLDRLDRIVAFDRGKVGVVAIGYTYRAPNVHRIAPNNFDGMRLLVERLVSHGLRRIGLCFHVPDLDARSNYGFSTALQISRQNFRLPVIRSFNEAWDKPAEARNWARQSRLHAVITTAPEVFRECEEGMLVVSLTEEAGDSGVSLTQAPEQLGALAADELFAVLLRNEVGEPRLPKLILTQLELRGI